MYLRNVWYAYAWAEEVKDNLFTRTILNEPVLTYRKEDNQLVAFRDMCPHRFAPLSLGKKCGNTVECLYHGLKFNEEGKCVYNPHGDKKIPVAAQLQQYPIEEKDSLIWIWMGDIEKADPTLIPDFDFLNHPEKYAYTDGMVTHMKASYDLITDNLLDLSHAAYLHPENLGSEAVSRGETKITQTGNTVLSENFYPNGKPAPVFSITGAADANEYIDYWVDVRWDPPGAMFFYAGITAVGASKASGKLLSSAQLLTPETDKTTHYFWKQFHSFSIDVPELTAAIQQAVLQAFEFEDEPVIEAVQNRMAGKDLWSLKPVLLSTDVGAVRVRRLMSKLIQDEKSL